MMLHLSYVKVFSSSLVERFQTGQQGYRCHFIQHRGLYTLDLGRPNLEQVALGAL